MADANSASDSQVLLQSMLQRLKLQTRPEINSTCTLDKVKYSTTATEQNCSAADSPPQTPPMYNFDFSTDSRRFSMARPPSPGPTGVSTSPSQEVAKGIGHNSGMSSTPKQRNLSWGFISNHTVSGGNSDVSPCADNNVMPTQDRNQNFSPTKLSDGSVLSLQSVERSLPSTHISGQTESNIQGQGVGQKRWTQKLKDKWKDRHRNLTRKERDDGERQDLSKVEHSIRSPIPVQTTPSENNTTTAFDKEISAQHQPIDNGPIEGIPGSFDHMGETLFSPGSFNLMEEIFTGHEWAKFLSSGTSSQPASTSIMQDQGTGLTSSISQSHQNEQTMFSQWNSRQATGPYLLMPQSQSFHSMDTTGNMFNQSKTPSFGMPPMSELHNSQYGLSDSLSNHLESMDLSVSTMGDNHPLNEQVYGYPYPSMNQSQGTEMNHHQPGRVHEVIPLLDLSYLQSKDGSSVKKQVPLSRKRGHSTESRDSNERWRSEPGDMHTWRHNSFHSDPAPSLSPASSTSSLQHSFSQDSETLTSTETVIKKRRVENTRHVRFAEEVTIVPPLVLSDDNGDDDDDDEDYGHNANEGNDDSGEESPPRTTVPRWIEALRSKTTRKPKLKLPRVRTKKYRFV